jgi:hypothetical protein
MSSMNPCASQISLHVNYIDCEITEGDFANTVVGRASTEVPSRPNQKEMIAKKYVKLPVVTSSIRSNKTMYGGFELTCFIEHSATQCTKRSNIQYRFCLDDFALAPCSSWFLV